MYAKCTIQNIFKVNALAHLDLQDNLMGKIPFGPISHVKTLRVLDLSNNRIEKVEDPFFSAETLKLDQLYLRENNILTLTSNSFANFEFINFTSLAGNPLRTIQDEAFKDAQMKKLDLSNCLLHSISAKAFKGLERNLEMLDLSANRLQILPDALFDDFDLIKDLRLSENMLSLSPNVSFNGFRYSIKDLSMLGEDMNYVPLNQIGIMRNLRTVGLAAVKQQGKLFASKTVVEYFAYKAICVIFCSSNFFGRFPKKLKNRHRRDSNSRSPVY